LKDAKADEDWVRACWTDEPNANVGLVTGIAFDGLDVDGPEGWTSLARLVDANGCLPSGPVSMTPRGGAHYLFAPTGIGNRTSFVPHLDWRGAGGYIVAPPSVHPNGGVYEWAISPDEIWRPWEHPGLIRSTQLSLEPAPGWLLELLKPAPPPLTMSRARPISRHGAYGQAALDDEIARVYAAAVGSRNHTLNRASFALGQLIGSGEISDAVGAVDDLLIAGRAVGLDEHEVQATVQSGITSGMRQPRSAAS
jgi:hypothetical protein